MRKTTLTANLVVVVFFVCFISYTFFARQHLNFLARDFVTEKTLDYSTPLMNVSGDALDSPMNRRILSNEQEIAIRQEIEHYRDDPRAYITNLTETPAAGASVPGVGPTTKRVTLMKTRVKTFYGDTLGIVVADLRVFSYSNLLAGLIGIGLAYRSSLDTRKSIVCFSLSMFLTVFYCSYLYVDGLTFFRILSQTHMGWWYAGALCAVIASLYFGLNRNVTLKSSGVRRGASERTASPPQSNSVS